MQAATAEFDAKKRVEMLQAATKTVFADVPVIPLYWQKVHWAGKANLTYVANMTEDTTPVLAGLAK